MNPIRFITICFLVLFLLIPPLSAADLADIDATSKTYVLLKEDPGGDNYVSAYEYVDLDLNDIGNWGLDFHSSGWIRQHLDTVPFEDEGEDRGEEELTYAFLSFIPFENEKIGKLKVNMGRQFLFSGTINEHIDGISTSWDYIKFVGFSAYFGVPVDDEVDDEFGDEVGEKRLTQIAGGRVYYRIANHAEIGLSYLKVEDDELDTPYREEIGLDLWAQPFDLVSIQGWSTYNDQTNNTMGHEYTITFFPMQSLFVSGLYAHINYNDYFVPSTSAAFLPEILNDGEEMDKYGGTVNYQVNNKINATFDYVNYSYDISGSANYYGVGFSSDNISGFLAGASMHRMDGDTAKLTYTLSRLYVGRKIWELDVVLDGVYLYLDESYAEKDYALSATCNVTYQMNDSLKFSSNIEYLEDGLNDHATKAFFSMIYEF
jgi:hypothetical protein